jgi:hypothetical protein
MADMAVWSPKMTSEINVCEIEKVKLLIFFSSSLSERSHHIRSLRKSGSNNREKLCTFKICMVIKD